MFSDVDISKAVRLGGKIGIEPYNPDHLQPASYDLTLSPNIKVLADESSDPDVNTEEFTDINLDGFGESGFIVLPGAFILASTVEEISISADVAARFEGKSSLGRQGLLTHISAGFIDPGFSGQITLEIACVSPRGFRLTSGMRIGQICFMPMVSPARFPYGHPSLGSHYQHQTGPTEARS